MKFWQWCAEDPRRRPYDKDLAPDQPTHLWFGSNWQDSSGERWIVRWTPATGEVYAHNHDWDVRPVGHIPGEDEFHAAWAAVRRLQSAPDSLGLLTAVMDDTPAIWGLEPKPDTAADDLDVEL